MSEPQKSRSKKRRYRSFREKCMPLAKIFAWTVVTGAVITASIFAFDTADESETNLPLPRIRRDLTSHSESASPSNDPRDTEPAGSPARLEIAATSQAQSINAAEDRDRLFNESVGFALNSPEGESIEATQFRPSKTTTSTGRVQANQAAWLTGQIEDFDLLTSLPDDQL